MTLVHELSDPAFQRPLSGLYWQVDDAGRVLLRSRSLWDEALALPIAGKPGQLEQHEVIGPGKQRLIVVERVVLFKANGEHPLHLAVAGERKIVDEARADFAKVVALSLVVLAGTPRRRLMGTSRGRLGPARCVAPTAE